VFVAFCGKSVTFSYKTVHAQGSPISYVVAVVIANCFEGSVQTV
jgi:hypothetical protein